MKNKLILSALCTLVLVGIYSLSAGKYPPFIPIDLFHAGVSNNAACTTCHTPGMQAPLQESHPRNEECFFCHKLKKSLS
jgi:hypothetical protein